MLLLRVLAVAYQPDDGPGDQFWLVVFVAMFYGALLLFLAWAFIRRWRQRDAYRMLRREKSAGWKVGRVHRERPQPAAWDEEADERERSAG